MTAVSLARTGEAPTEPALQPELGAASWRALGTYVELRTDPAVLARAAALVADVLLEVDRACSRFRDDSDLSRVNATAHAGAGRRGRPAPVPVSPLLVAAVRVALEAADETDGLVDPTLGAVLAAAGYDCTFTRVRADDASVVSLPRRRGGWRDVEVTDETVGVPEGAWLDLGATGKAFAADLAALTVQDALGVTVAVSVGGDVRVAPYGRSGVAGEASYDVLVAHSAAELAADGPMARLVVRAGGIATSSTAARRWRRAGHQWHHLVDPRTGSPAQGPWRTVTALGATAAAANTASTAAVVLGEQALPWLVERGVAARLVDHHGGVTRTPEWVAAGVEQQEAS